MRRFFIILSILSGFYLERSDAHGLAPSEKVIAIGYGENHEEAELSGQVRFILDDYAGEVLAKKVENAAVEIEGGLYSQLIVHEARGQNSFSAADGRLGALDFRRPSDPLSPGSGSFGLSDEGTVFNFGDSGQGLLLVKFTDIAGGSAAGRAATVNLYDDAQLRQNFGGTVTGHVNLNFLGDSFQTFEGFGNFGQTHLDSLLTIGGTNFALSPDGGSSTVVGLANIHGGRDGHVTAVAAGGAGPVDYLFSVENGVKGGAFAFYYNGATARQGNELKIGAAGEDTEVLIGGSNDRAAVRLTDLIGGREGRSTNLTLEGGVKITADTVQNTVNIINNNAAPGAVVLENVLDGALNLGGGGSNIVLQWVNASGEGLRLGSLDNERPAAVEAAALGRESGFSNTAKITLGNARLQLAADGSGLNYSAGGSRFKMDSSNGHSWLDAARVEGDFDFGPGREPAILVGGGGQVVMENNRLTYAGALESAPEATAGGGFDGRVAFDGAGENRLVFFSHGLNSFNGGFKIDDRAANIEFAGSSFLNGFTDTGETSRLRAGHIHFTGLDNSADPLEASRISFGNGFIDPGGGTVHLNNSLLLAAGNGRVGGLGTVARLIMGDGTGFLSGAPAAVTLLDTSVSAGLAAVGGQGAQINAAVAVGGRSAMENSLNISETLTVGGKTVINGHLGALARADGGPAFYFTAPEAIELTDAAKFSHIDPGTVFMIDPALADLLGDGKDGFAPLKAAEGASEISPRLLASLAANLVFSDSNLEKSGFDFDPFSGMLSRGSGPAGRPRPGYAAPLEAAALAHNPLLGQYILRGPGLSESRYYQELAQIMGNTVNAALNLSHTGAGLALRRLDKMAALGGPLPAAGNAAGRITDGFWLNTAVGRLAIDGNYRQGYGSLRADASGLTLGYDLEAKRFLRAGLFAGLNVSEMKSAWQKIESETLEAGVYGQLYLPLGLVLNAAASYSWQTHGSGRDIALRGTLGESFNQKLSADFSGDSLNFQAELKRPLTPGGNFYFAPSLGYVYQGVLLEPFQETSNLAEAPQCDLSQISAGVDFDIHQLKAGADISWRAEGLALSGRARWLQNLGDTRPQSRAVFARSAAPKIFNIHGAEMDRQMLNLGLGIDWRPQFDGLSVGLDYEGLLGAGTKAHTLNLSVSYNF